MSDNFIPLHQSTPVRNRWQHDKNQQQQRHYNYQQNTSSNRGQGGFNQWRNNSQSSYGTNSSNNSFSQDKNNIDAWLHPSMLQDPWANLRQNCNRKENK